MLPVFVYKNQINVYGYRHVIIISLIRKSLFNPFTVVRVHDAMHEATDKPAVTMVRELTKV